MQQSMPPAVQAGSMPPAMQAGSQTPSMQSSRMPSQQAVASMQVQSLATQQPSTQYSSQPVYTTVDQYKAQSLPPQPSQSIQSQPVYQSTTAIKDSPKERDWVSEEGPTWHSEVEGFIWGMKEDYRGNYHVGGEVYRSPKNRIQESKPRGKDMRSVKLEIERLRKENEKFRQQHQRKGCLQSGAMDAEECLHELHNQLADTVWENERRVSDIQSHVRSLQKENNSLRDKIPGLEAKLYQLRPVITSLEREVNSTMSALSTKDRELKSLEAQAKTLGREIAEAEQQRRGCEEGSSAANAELEALQKQTLALLMEVESLEQQAEQQGRCDPSINEIRASEEIIALRNRHDSLKADLDAMKSAQAMWPAP